MARQAQALLGKTVSLDNPWSTRACACPASPPRRDLSADPLRLEDIGNLLAIRDTGTCPCEPAADFLTRRLAEVDAQIRRLEALRAEMVAMHEGLPAWECPQPVPGTWLPPEGR